MVVMVRGKKVEICGVMVGLDCDKKNDDWL